MLSSCRSGGRAPAYHPHDDHGPADLHEEVAEHRTHSREHHHRKHPGLPVGKCKCTVLLADTEFATCHPPVGHSPYDRTPRMEYPSCIQTVQKGRFRQRFRLIILHIMDCPCHGGDILPPTCLYFPLGRRAHISKKRDRGKHDDPVKFLCTDHPDLHQHCICMVIQAFSKKEKQSSAVSFHRSLFNHNQHSGIAAGIL